MNNSFSNNRVKITLVLLIIIEFFNGISALAGGLGILSDPSGKTLGMESILLEGFPFKNLLIPGIILFVFHGIGNTLAAVYSLKRGKYMNEVAILFGIGMMIWIIVQVYIIGYGSLLQPLYFSTGLLQAILGFIIKRTYNRSLG